MASGKNKPGLIGGCLTSAIAIIVAIYVVVLLGSAAIKTFLENRGGVQLTTQAAQTQPSSPANSAAPQPAAPTVTPVDIPATTGSTSAGGAGSGSLSYVPAAPAISQIGMTASAPYYIVEQADLTQNGSYLSFDQSMKIIAAKLLTTVDALKQNNSALNTGTLVAGQVLLVPSAVVTGGGGGNLPPTGRYASP
jgi:hypothetical protein